jgi:hypothetical protein
MLDWGGHPNNLTLTQFLRKNSAFKSKNSEVPEVRTSLYEFWGKKFDPC